MPHHCPDTFHVMDAGIYYSTIASRDMLQHPRCWIGRLYHVALDGWVSFAKCSLLGRYSGREEPEAGAFQFAPRSHKLVFDQTLKKVRIPLGAWEHCPPTQCRSWGSRISFPKVTQQAPGRLPLSSHGRGKPRIFQRGRSLNHSLRLRLLGRR